MLIKLVVLAILSVPSILAASISKQIAGALIANKDTGKLEQTFQALHKEHDGHYSSDALTEVAKQGHSGIVVTCLRVAPDPFPNDKMFVNILVHGTFSAISHNTRDDPESFVKVITSFKPTDVKPLACIRFNIFLRGDAVDVFKRVMEKSSELIIDTLPSWLAFHTFDRNSPYCTHNQTVHGEAFQYLTSFATENVLERALSIVKANEHYKADIGYGHELSCCRPRDYIPQDLIDKLNTLLELMKARNELVKAALAFMPAVLLKLLAEYITYETIDSPTSIPKTIIGTKRKHH
jgi:hypothetical protein